MRREKFLEVFRNLPTKRKQVLLGILKGDASAKIMADAEVSSSALTQHKRQLYKDFQIEIIQHETDDPRSGERKLPQLIALCAQFLPDLVSQSSASNYFDIANTTEGKLRRDWGNAPNIPVFFGRTSELETLEQWIVEEQCRLVAIVGMSGIGKTRLSRRLGQGGGIGKTDLSLRLAEGIEDSFRYVIWRSLRDAPPVIDTLRELTKFLSDQQDIDLPKTIEEQVSKLLDYLRQHSCLIMLDNIDSILQGGTRAGQYLEGYEGYGRLFFKIGEVAHQSCLLLTSREKPQNLERLVGKTKPVRFLMLDGLDYKSGQKIFEEIGNFHGSDEDWKKLVKFYKGNPLALELTANHIQDVFDGDVHRFLNRGKQVFDDMRELLNWHFDRLSASEKEIMYWLAINREPVSMEDLEDDVLSRLSKEEISSTLQSLQRRLPLERTEKGFSLQPFIIEYVTEKLINHICEEIKTGELDLFSNYALLKGTAKDYIRESQVRVIIEPIVNKLIASSMSTNDIVQRLKQILGITRTTSSWKLGYAGGNILNLLCCLDTSLSNYDFSQINVWQAYLKSTTLHDIKFTNSDLSRTVFSQTFGTTLSVAFSPNGEFLATGDTEGEIRLWRIEDDQLSSIFRSHDDWIWSIAFSPDGQTLATGSGDRTAKIWDIGTGQCLRTLGELDQHQINEEVALISFSTDGQALIIASRDGVFQWWDITSGQYLHSLATCRAENSNVVSSVAISPDELTLATDSQNGAIDLWDINTNRCLRTLQGHTDWTCSITFNSDGKILASGSEDCTVRLWNVETGQCLGILEGHSGAVKSVVFDPSGEVFVSASHDQTLRLWEMSTQQCTKVFQGHKNRVISTAFNPSLEAGLADGNRILASSADDQTIKLWDVNTGQCIRTLQGYTNWIQSVALSPDNRTIVGACQDGTLILWDAITNERLNCLDGHSNIVHSVTFSPDGQIIASGSEDDTIQLWNAHTGQLIQTLAGNITAVRSVSFSPDSEILASCHWDRKVRLWNVNTGQCFRVLEGHTDWMRSIAFNPTGQIVISSSNDQTVKLWNVDTGECFKTLYLNTVGQSAIFSPDGRRIATANEDCTIKFWDGNTGEYISSLQGHNLAVRMAVISSDCQILASCSYDQTIRIWDINTGQCLRVLRGHTSPVNSVFFGKDTQVLVSGSGDGTVKCWDSQTGDLLKTLRPSRPYEGIDVTGVTGITEAQKTTLKLLGAVDASE